MREPPILPDVPVADFHARITRRGRARALGHRRAKQMALRRFAVLAAALAVPALGAPGSVEPRDAAPHLAEAQVRATGFDPQADHFAGSAFAYREPARVLAAEAPAANAPASDPGPAARAFRRAGSITDLARAQHCLTQAIYYEAASEPEAGQRAVAQVVLNRVAHPSWPGSVCGVVFQGTERGTGCQFTFTCDGSLARAPSPAFWTRAARIARAALAGAVHAPVGLATHYHTLAVSPPWAASLEPVAVIGAHQFYRTPGPGGAPAAFAARYVGGEPAVGARPGAPAVAVALPALAVPVPNQSEPAASAPALASAGESRPVSGTVRREYVRSGTWLAESAPAGRVTAAQ